MKITVVPAQVTTVEDRIIGNLGFSQMILLVIPIFFGGTLFAALPPVMNGSVYKYIAMGILAFTCCTLAIRIKGKIIATWLVTILRYNLRPKYYLFNKNTSSFRQDYPLVTEPKGDKKTREAESRQVPRPRLNTPEAARVLAVIASPAAKFRFETTKKGGLHVRLTEIED